MRRLGPLRRLVTLIPLFVVLWLVVLPKVRDRDRAAEHAAPPVATAPAPEAAAGDATTNGSGFGAAVGFRSEQRLAEHFDKHGREFGAASEAEYLALAQALRDRPAGGDVRELTRADGVTCRFDRASGAFLAFNRDGTIRTYFKPNDGERYFERQAERP
ncbi:MAG: hypothetical protein U0704_05500 [Candidatus Eisenbacteria bacterium]